MEFDLCRTHGRAYTPSMEQRLGYPHIATLSNAVDETGNLLVLQRVVKVKFVLRNHQLPFSTDFAVIEENDDLSSFAFFTESSGLSLQTQMRIRLLTGFEFTEILQDRCIRSSCFSSDLHFLQRFDRQFALRKKGFSSRENSMSVSLFSNMLASVAIHPMEPAVVYENCTTAFQWSVFERCDSTGCVYSDASCGYEEGFILLVLTEWDVAMARAFFTSLIYSVSNTVGLWVGFKGRKVPRFVHPRTCLHWTVCCGSRRSLWRDPSVRRSLQAPRSLRPTRWPMISWSPSCMPSSTAWRQPPPPSSSCIQRTPV